MPSQDALEASIDRSTAYNEFISSLEKYHEKRGTVFESEPKVGQKRIDLLRLFTRVVQAGGYDEVSDTKVERGQWRNIGVELGLDKATHPSALAFMLKTVYYKNLAAYEISTVHGKEPPPKEILEEVSAKGGNLLGRTVESYQGLNARRGSIEDRVFDRLSTSNRSEADNNMNARASREGLRHAPLQRQLFQSDNLLGRPVRPQVTNSPASLAGGHHMFGNATAAQALANYEPKTPISLSIQPVMTPASNYDSFKTQQLALRDACSQRSSRGHVKQKNNIMLPGTGFPGPNIYIRTWMALKSPILVEQEYALHHLVKISHEKGDKYRLDNFGGLAEALLDKLLEITTFYTDLTWTAAFEETAAKGQTSTYHDNLSLISCLQKAKPRIPRDKFETHEMGRRLKLINEAGLVTRNLVMLDDNAEYMSKYPAMINVLVIFMNLPADPSVAEVKHYAFEIAEQLTRFIPSSSNNAIISSLIWATSGVDRGLILTALRALSRAGTKSNHALPTQAFPPDMLHRLYEWLLVDDHDLRATSLDLIYRLTASTDGVENFLRELDVASLTKQLVRLLQNGAHHEHYEDTISAQNLLSASSVPEPSGIPKISADHVDMLLTYDEPERSSQWLRACFEEHIHGEITQIALWQAYQIPFNPFSTARPLLPAKDFITNVSNTFAHASAQVLSSDPPKFVIKGIRPRLVPLDPKGKPFMKCRWYTNTHLNGECPEFALTASRMWEHVISAHLGVQMDTDGTYDFANMEGTSFHCRWGGCRKFDAEIDPVSPFTVGMHIKTHLPDSSSSQWRRGKHNVSIDPIIPLHGSPPGEPVARSWSTSNTHVDERLDATGLPLTSILILRNLARNIPKQDSAAGEDEDVRVWAEARSLLKATKSQLYFVFAHNRSLGEALSSLFRLIDED